MGEEILKLASDELTKREVVFEEVCEPYVETDNKYYVPDISEFHPGFEFEERREIWDREYPGIKVLEYIWEPVTMHLGHGIQGSLNYIVECLDPRRQNKHYRFTDGPKGFGAYSNIIRVKYLDKEDVESLRFVCNTINTKEDFFILNNIRLSYSYEEHVLVICIGLNICFRGIIKNKSELKTLLKQLNIEQI